MRLRLVPRDHKIVYPIVEDCCRPPRDFKPRLPRWLASELFLDQFSVIAIEMDIAAHPYQFARLKIALLGQHADEQRGTPQIERQTQRDIAATLIA